MLLALLTCPQGRHAFHDELKTLTRKQLVDLCSSLHQHVETDVQLTTGNYLPQDEEEQALLLLRLVRCV